MSPDDTMKKFVLSMFADRGLFSRVILVCLVVGSVNVSTAQDVLNSNNNKGNETTACSLQLLDTCSLCWEQQAAQYDCSLPGLESFTPGQYEGVKVNYLSFVTETSSPMFPSRAREFEGCTGGKIVFAEAANVWEDPLLDLGTKTSRGREIYDGYWMSYSHFPEVAALDLAEHLNDRIREDNARLHWEDVLPKVRAMSEYRKNGVTNLDFLMFDGDFFVPIVRLDLLEEHNIPLPNTWEEVTEIAIKFNGTDLNGDGEPDYGICHFPRLGAGNWDWWFSEAVYSTWATSDQTEGIEQGFFFDIDTMEPRIGAGFRRAANIWKDLWVTGSNCENTNFVDGKCAIGFGPPGCWKQVFLNGVSRKDENNTKIWEPKLKNGGYAEPYRFKPFGSIQVVDRDTGEMKDCTKQLCPKAEVIPPKGHHGDNDRARILPESPLAGKLINRAPFYWSGGLGTLIRKSTEEDKKDLMWDFFVYINSGATAVYDVANYASWLDSWRYSQLSQGDNFLEAGWSQDAYREHANVMNWALSNDVNGAFNIRLPGIVHYTRDVVGKKMDLFIRAEITEDELVEQITKGWKEVTNEQGKLDQLEIYRSQLGLDTHSEVELCRMHRDLMDERDPSICRKYDPLISNQWVLIPAIVVPLVAIAFVVAIFIYMDRKRRRADAVWEIKRSEIYFGDRPEVLGRGTFGLVLLAEYRGTLVAVKRVIPPNKSGKNENKTDDGFDDVLDLEAPEESEMPSYAYASIAMPITEVTWHSTEETERSNDQSAKPSVMMSGGQRVRRSGEDQRPWTSLYRRLAFGDDYAKLKADFINEMRHLSKLRHPCITTVMGAVSTDDPLLVMELMERSSLYDVLHNETVELNGDMILPILRDVSQGMRFLHAAEPQVIHGDLKAANVLVDARFRAKISDFGLSGKKSVGASGTPLWMAPELLRRESNNTPYSDAYSFGIVLHEVYSRKDPYWGEDLTDILFRISDPEINHRPPVPERCSLKIQTIMAECLDRLPEKRPTFEELDLQLKRLGVDKVEPKRGDTSEQTNDITERLMLSEAFPAHVADALRNGRQVEPETRECVTILFCEIVGFDKLSSTLAPLEVSSMLDRYYKQLDHLSEVHDVFVIDTVGNAYMAVSNLVKDQTDHAARIAAFAVDIVEAAKNTLINEEIPTMGTLDIKIGLNSGPVVANVVGTKNPRYCLFGDTVNTGSRIKAVSKRNRILCSERSAELLDILGSKLHLKCRGHVGLRGKGEIVAYWVSKEAASLELVEQERPKDKFKRMPNGVYWF